MTDQVEPVRGVPFLKMHGLANDYVLLDGFVLRRPGDLPGLARRMLDRRRGVGGDGLLWVAPQEGADARMEIYNADGSRAEMCGNGIRCVGRFLSERRARGRLGKGVRTRQHGGPGHDGMECEKAATEANFFEVVTDVGPRRVEVLAGTSGEVRVRVDMRAPIWSSNDLPAGPGGTPFVERPLPVEVSVAEAAGLSPGVPVSATAVSMGNPHCVVFVADVNRVNLSRAGPAIEGLDLFPQGANVSFADLEGPRGELRQRTWERGVGETHACGTGACAVFAAARRTRRVPAHATIHLRGGALDVEQSPEGNIWMSGEATLVCAGRWFGTAP